MRPKAAFRPSLNRLEQRIVPTVGAYPDPVRTAIHESYVAKAESGPTNVAFLGDSITYKWRDSGSAAWQANFGSIGADNFGIIGDQAHNLLYRVQDGEFAGQPKVAVVMVGINDLFGGETPKQADTAIAQVVDAIKVESPSTKILLLSVLPTASSTLNVEVNQLDGLLNGLGKQAGVTYLDVESSFMGENNIVQAGLTADGVHPSVAGYAVLAQAIDPTLVSLLNPAPAPTVTTPTVSTKPTSDVVFTVPTTPATTIIPIDLGTTTTDTTEVTPTVAHHKSTSAVIESGPSS